MSYQSDASFLAALIRGVADPLAPGVLGRVTIMRARYRGRDNAGMMDLINRADEALATAQVAEDRAFLESLIDGSGDLLSLDAFPRMEHLFAKYAEGSDMFVLLEKAVEAFSTAVQEAATWVQAGYVIEVARFGAADDEWCPD